MTGIVLYGFDGSTYVRTVRMLLAEKGAHYLQVPVNVLKGEPRRPEEGTWGWDYQGWLLPRRVISSWWHGRRY